MRPPILYLTIAFGAGLLAALNGVEMRVTAWCVLAGAAFVYRPAPLGAAVGVMLVAGTLWGAAAVRERSATCGSQWSNLGSLTPGWQPGVSKTATHSAIVQLADPAVAAG
ncbi:MAG TPA: hypothetical protein VMR92_08885, partial [Gemmatimonadales bacterium]|nr:hypothetical protein [Gemmatimonadales bacterium]